MPHHTEGKSAGKEDQKKQIHGNISEKLIIMLLVNMELKNSYGISFRIATEENFVSYLYLNVWRRGGGNVMNQDVT